jgi:uncharacterized lipoprotein YddW (UPF0748 family)
VVPRLHTSNRMKLQSQKSIILMMITIIVMLPAMRLIAQTETEYVEELRGVWVTNVASDVLNNKARLAAAMDYLASNGINVIFPVVWNKAETQYRSQIMLDLFGNEIDPLYGAQGRDPLAELIVEAHRNGMEVMPWFEYGFAAIFGDQTGGRIIQKFPHWASVDVNGAFTPKNGFYWMNAIHPEVQDFMSSLIHEVIDNYDIDGIQGDDRLPAMATELGYDDYTVELYKSEHNGASPPAFFKNNEWLIWRADKLTNYLGRLYRSVKEKDENLIVSMSPSPYRFGFNEYLQDIPRWLDSNYVDIIHPQLYRFNPSDYLRELNNAAGFKCGTSGFNCNDPNELVGGYVKSRDTHKFFPGIIIRSGNNNVGPAAVRQKLAYNRELGINGEVFFFYEGMGANNSFLADTLKKYFYQQPAVLPYREGQLRRPPPVIVNETDTGAARTGSWQAVIPRPTPTGYEGRSLRANANSNSEILYNMEVPYDAWYRVFAYVPYDFANRNDPTTTAHYTVYYNDGADSLVTVVNQMNQYNQGWVPIGNVRLEAGNQPVVRIRTSDITDGKPIFADAVMLLLDRQKSPDVNIPVPIVTSIDDERVAPRYHLAPICIRPIRIRLIPRPTSDIRLLKPEWSI